MSYYLAEQPKRFTLRWKKVWETDDKRGSVQRYTTAFGLRIFDAYLDGKHLGQAHRMPAAKKLVTDAMAAS